MRVSNCISFAIYVWLRNIGELSCEAFGVVRCSNCKMTKWKIGAVCGTALLIAAAVVVALRERQALPEAPVAQAPTEVRVKAVERKTEPVEQHIWTLFASHAHLRVGFAHLRVKSAADEPVASSLGEGGNLGVAGAGRWFRTRCRRS